MNVDDGLGVNGLLPFLASEAAFAIQSASSGIVRNVEESASGRNKMNLGSALSPLAPVFQPSAKEKIPANTTESTSSSASSDNTMISDSPGVTVHCLHCKIDTRSFEDYFFKAEELGVAINPKCGACKCNKCPIPGAKYSFKEQQEYDTIEGNLICCDNIPMLLLAVYS